MHGPICSVSHFLIYNVPLLPPIVKRIPVPGCVPEIRGVCSRGIATLALGSAQGYPVRNGLDMAIQAELPKIWDRPPVPPRGSCRVDKCSQQVRDLRVGPGTARSRTWLEGGGRALVKLSSYFARTLSSTLVLFHAQGHWGQSPPVECGYGHRACFEALRRGEHIATCPKTEWTPCLRGNSSSPTLKGDTTPF
jgi:hypothetical protein